MNTVEKLNTVLYRVAHLLQVDECLRNDDLALVCGYWKTFDPNTSPSTVIRARQKLQAQGYLLPTDPEVLRRRRKREIEMREWTRT